MVEIDRRPPATSQYRLVPERIMALAKLHQQRKVEWDLAQEIARAGRWGDLVRSVAVGVALAASSPTPAEVSGASLERDVASASAPDPTSPVALAAAGGPPGGPASEHTLPPWARSVAIAADLGADAAPWSTH